MLQGNKRIRRGAIIQVSRERTKACMKFSMRLIVMIAALAVGQASWAQFDVHKRGVEAEPHCPQLPKHSGYEWEWIFNVDWGHCVGRSVKTHKAAFDFGVARVSGGVPPGELEPDSAFVESGTIGRTPVKWYRATVHLGPDPLEYRTFTPLNADRTAYLSIRVYAESRAQMDERLRLIERITLR